MKQAVRASANRTKALYSTKVALASETLSALDLHLMATGGLNFEKARIDAETIWPWVGFDRTPAKKEASQNQEDVDLLGVLDFDKLKDWLAKNPESVTPFLLHMLCRMAHISGRRQVKAKAASLKNVAMREWVLSEWKNRPDQSQGKAAFSRQYSILVKQRSGLLVNPDTIARGWLPKAKA